MISRLLPRFIIVGTVMAMVLGFFVGQSSPISAATNNSISYSVGCTKINWVSGSITPDRNTTGAGSETITVTVTDGAGTVLVSVSINAPLGVAGNPGNPTYATSPQYNPLTLTIESPAGNGFSKQTVYSTEGACAGLSTLSKSSSEPQFFTPGDGRIDGKAGDRVAVYCNPSEDRLVVYGVDDSGKGFYLTTFSHSALVVAGSQGLTKHLGITGDVSLSGDGKGTYWLAWNGGPYRANGQGDFPKKFSCIFGSGTTNIQLPPPPKRTEWIDKGKYDYLIEYLLDREQEWERELSFVTWLTDQPKGWARGKLIEMGLSRLGAGAASFVSKTVDVAINFGFGSRADAQRNLEIFRSRRKELESYWNNPAYRYFDFVAIPSILKDLPTVSFPLWWKDLSLFLDIEGLLKLLK